MILVGIFFSFCFSITLNQEDKPAIQEIELLGTLPRDGKERVISLRFSEDGKYLACQVIVMYLLRSEVAKFTFI